MKTPGSRVAAVILGASTGWLFMHIGYAFAQAVAPAPEAPPSGVLVGLVNLFGGSFIPPLALALAAWVCKEIIDVIQNHFKPWIAAHTDWMEARTGVDVAAAVNSGLDAAQGVMCTLVNSAENTAVEGFKKAGTWTDPAVQKQVRDAVLADAKLHIAAVAPQLAAQAGDGLQNLLGHMLEHEVAKLSSQPKIVDAKEPLDTLPAPGSSPAAAAAAIPAMEAPAPNPSKPAPVPA